MALERPRVRLARCLINLSEGYGERKAEPPTRVRVSQERLGMMLSLSRQTVNELLRDLERSRSFNASEAAFASLIPAG